MRCMLKYSFPTTAESNARIRDGSIGQKGEPIFEAIRPEAVYFCPVDRDRG